MAKKKKKETKKEKLKVATNELSQHLSDYIFNYNYSFAELDIAYERAKEKLRAEIQELYNKVN